MIEGGREDGRERGPGGGASSRVWRRERRATAPPPYHTRPSQPASVTHLPLAGECEARDGEYEASGGEYEASGGEYGASGGEYGASGGEWKPSDGEHASAQC
eukprot:2860751-Rhodomonas_salina.1